MEIKANIYAVNFLIHTKNIYDNKITLTRSQINSVFI